MEEIQSSKGEEQQKAQTKNQKGKRRTITVPADKFFALGDNRDDSADSRFWGFLDRNDIRGKAWRIYWSADGLSNIRLNRIGRAVE